ncbi:hypothetical protein SISSUDRAFT_1057832 [Sistotremastrum suecicum HHB10207 ss-3]|uniref:Uncharacterized protein n=1 Tax=Sistotremastrum suecicum HHB10207 ss-3 TaxID=1314776 RepID=A0A166I6A9_9AGAM|nr:hypothetical protein SISSUDRAFT_1057832 [Sistotremastrum suecicum HHB10207 ss-3]
MSSFLYFVGFSGFSLVHAAPSVQRRQSGSDGSGIQSSVYIPVIVILAALFAIILAGVLRRKWKARQASQRGANSNSETTSTRQLTAERLTSGNRQQTNAQNTTSNANATRPSRPRRTRRTPSQMSVTSLPLYMEDPGDTELVLVRSEREMEDEPDSLHRTESYPDSQNSGNDAMPHSMSSQTLGTMDPDHSRQSFETHMTGSDESGARLMPTPQPEDPRGEAPAYFEVVDQDHDSRRSPGPAPTSPNRSSASNPRHSQQPASSSEGTGLMPTLRSFFSRIPGPPTISTSPSSSDPASRHRSNTSASGSTANLLSSSSPSSLLTRSRSRLNSHQRSTSAFSSTSSLTGNPNLTSPSMISLTSISAPLPHTLVRTEFTYPKNGPTPEQIKFIASRESLGRFGVPWGDLAVAHARERERDGVEPPSFDSVASADVSPSRQADEEEVEPELEGSGRSLPPVGEESHPSRPVSIRVVSASTVQTFETAPEIEREVETPTPGEASTSDPSIRPSSPMTLTPPPTPPRTAIPITVELASQHGAEASPPTIVVDTSA